ncbi:hypothetical protein NDU88_003269 [Pleurodeles waltl]|uniref:Uncharacterized protein n=1 Tax=Pleurodeles waltl TaxID=8319 RepID=A0AAV7NG52_PLEWA|nr:hypothetical protein NDU88_003269 [Pleurodeles waltl]
MKSAWNLHYTTRAGSVRSTHKLCLPTCVVCALELTSAFGTCYLYELTDLCMRSRQAMIGRGDRPYRFSGGPVYGLFETPGVV